MKLNVSELPILPELNKEKKCWFGKSFISQLPIRPEALLWLGPTCLSLRFSLALLSMIFFVSSEQARWFFSDNVLHKLGSLYAS